MMLKNAKSPGMTFVNADISVQGRRYGTLRVVGSRIAALGGAPEEADRIVDLRGDRLLPGLINAHDHLQLNTLPALSSGKRYRHVREWISDVDARRRTDSEFEARVAVSRDERLLIGGVKNLLSGVTTVAHHDPLYPFLASPDFPVHVLMNYGWSHSLYLDGDEEVRNSYRRTAPGWPWIIHAAEGVDDEAGSEFERLEALGCLGPNSLIVHGVALDHARRVRLERAAAGLIWCPTSNLRLFGTTAEVADLARRGRVALGTDSRLSGARDLLAELRVAREVSGLDEETLESLVTENGAALLQLTDRGLLKVGYRADLVILSARVPLSRATRADVRLVMFGGSARFGERVYAQTLAPSVQWAEVRVDGVPKVLESNLHAALCGALANEPGLELSNLKRGAA
jgi:cytosine/adenosine deaminase-related metal-dependent hydrolase